jgi:hypothetical protein
MKCSNGGIEAPLWKANALVQKIEDRHADVPRVGVRVVSLKAP